MLDEKTPQPSAGLRPGDESKKRFTFSSVIPSAPPPEYSERDATTGLANLSLSSTDSPTVDQCIAHLKLLESFHALRQAVSKTDGLFGIHDDLVSKSEKKNSEEELLKVYEKRWAIYVARAADRFESWWSACVPSSCKGQPKRPLAEMDLQGGEGVEFSYLPSGGDPIKFTADNLPPLGT
ncbi:hypothetical protein GP486_005364 [Trichoglossum hirsutum]|uniref:Uncharacterized protein n=1 Tax=Trichoglossum hirsutum TaxID=265104 RepID=A0A9P8L998_9PEZI|nr:hypothetical protein GP486_005364 [Trichoglossum hirsutum]